MSKTRWTPRSARADRHRHTARRTLRNYWTDFAKTGDPNASGLHPWPTWSDTDKAFLVVTADASVTVQRNFPPLFSSLGATDLKRRLQNLQH